MIFGRRNKNIDDTPKVVEAEMTELPASNQPNIDTLIKTPEVQLLIREEAKRIKMKEQRLTEPQLARMEDSLRLCETKLENMRENQARAQKQQELLRRYQELKLEHYEQKQHLYAANKLIAAHVNERNELERFEEFENVQAPFQRLQLLEQMRISEFQTLSTLTRQSEECSKLCEEEEKMLINRQEEMQNAQRQFSLAMDATGEVQHIEGELTCLNLTEHDLNKGLEQLRSQQTIDMMEQKELTLLLEQTKDKLAALRTRRQSLVPHQSMVAQSFLTIERLERYADLESRLSRVETEQRDCQRKLQNENDMMERAYADYLQVQQDIQTLQDELSVHREQNHGMESYRLQERAMKLKLRRQLLLGARSLWSRISDGYANIENYMQELNPLRLKLETLSNDIKKQEEELAVLRRSCKEKEYTYTMSKSQNVIQLRSDLKEGTSCTVCGATHHPYHADTMLEQNKLIGEFKMEFEGLENELRAKENSLMQLRLEEAATSATKEVVENTLITLRQLQNGYVSDWEHYSQLNPTFSTCDSGVNSDARTAILRQLVESIDSEVDEAQKELDTFNFHQSRINEISEQLTVKEQRKNELIARLNEVNTGCQVMSSLKEHISNHRHSLSTSYNQLFEVIDKMMTIPDWLTIWKRSHEALFMHIQEITQEWNELEENLNTLEHQQQLYEKDLLHASWKVQAGMALITTTEELLRKCNESTEKRQKRMEKLVGSLSSKQYLEKFSREVDQISEQLKQQTQKTHEANCRKKEVAGQLVQQQAVAQLINELIVAERQKVDCWIRNYNANHPPVQYVELEAIFSKESNWNEMRQHQRTIIMDQEITQARVDKVGSQLVALQAEVSMRDGDVDLLQHQLATQIQGFEKKIREVMIQMATLTLQLEGHRKAIESEREEKIMEVSK